MRLSPFGKGSDNTLSKLTAPRDGIGFDFDRADVEIAALRPRDAALIETDGAGVARIERRGDWGLTAPGSIEMFKVFVLTTTG